MKKLYLIVAVMLAMTLIVGCGSSPAPASRSNSPAWMADIPGEDEIYGIGFAKLQNPSLGMQTATTRAQTDAARQIGALVKAMLTDYANESGLASNPRSMVAIENIEQNLVNMQLSATTNKREEIDGTWWVRVAVKKSDAKRQIDNIVKNETADYAEFRAAQALDRLNRTIDSSSIKGTGLGE